MIGAIIGDIVGSRFEFNNHKSKEFELFTKDNRFTDDTVMTLAIANAILETETPDELSQSAIRNMQMMGRKYPKAGYGGMFQGWLKMDNPEPIGSFGNGAAMRVSACAYIAESVEEAKAFARAVTEVTHNHPEGIKGAEATAVAIYMALHGYSIDDIEDYMDKYYYRVDFTLNGIRNFHKFSATCQKTMPVALAAFYESTDFEDAIRNAISVGGDSDTIAAITGAIAEAYYGVPDWIREKALGYLDDFQKDIIEKFESVYGGCNE